MRILITGGAGFIGAALAHRALDEGHRVHLVDNLSDYYEVSLKEARLARLTVREGCSFQLADIADRGTMSALFRTHRFEVVVNMAAQAGVRYSLENPAAYVDANLTGFGNILEGCRRSGVGHLVFASSSSVYGGNTRLPFREDDPVDHPVSLYAATKKSNEVMAHSYSHLYDLPCTGVRFFTVYGPWGRPDMAFFRFTRLMLGGRPIPVYNHGRMWRDFTYIDDAVEGLFRLLEKPATPSDTFSSENPTPAESGAPYRILNLGNGRKVDLLTYIATLESCLDVRARYEMLPMQDGDVVATLADITRLEALTGYRPSTSVESGLTRFCSWYREYVDV